MTGGFLYQLEPNYYVFGRLEDRRALDRLT